MSLPSTATLSNLNPISLSTWEEILLELISIRSHTGEEREVALAVERHLRALFPNAEVSRQPVSPDRWNIIMSKGAPQVTLTTHIDTVPGGPSPSFTAEKILGRGACDAKGQLVAQLWGLHMAVSQGLKHYRCAFVVGEETDAIGARTLLSLPTTPYILNGEPTHNHFVSRSWGAVDVEIKATGVSAHSSLGTDNSAIHHLVSDLANLLRDGPPDISLNVGRIEGGIASNVQAPFASCTVCARMRGDRNDIERFLSERLIASQWSIESGAAGGVELFVPPRARGSEIEARFASDCSVYAQRYKRVMLFGPGGIEHAHTDQESISRDELRIAAETIRDLLVELEAEARQDT